MLTRYRTRREPEFIKGEIGKRILIEQVDITDLQALLELGERHRITGIVDLAAPGIGVHGLVEDLQISVEGLLNV